MGSVLPVKIPERGSVDNPGSREWWLVIGGKLPLGNQGRGCGNAFLI
jgi:hypothetical protein